MYISSFLVILPFLSLQQRGKKLTETDDAYILDVDLDDNNEKNPQQTRLLSTGNQVVDGALVGVGVGVVGSLLLGKLLEKQNGCHFRYKRDGTSTRFLPTPSHNNCPPAPFHQPNNGYQPSNVGYQQPPSGYQPVNVGYQHQPPATVGYQPQHAVNVGYQHQPPVTTVGYQPPPPLTIYNPPVNTYNPPTNTYNPPINHYQPIPPINPPTNAYHPSGVGSYPPNTGYQAPIVKNSNRQSFSQASAHKPTPAPFKFGVGR